MHSGTNAQIWPWLARKSGHNQTLNGVDFCLMDRDGYTIEPYDLDDARRCEDGEPVVQVETAKEVTWEKGFLDDLNAVRPQPSALIQGNKRLITLTA